MVFLHPVEEVRGQVRTNRVNKATVARWAEMLHPVTSDGPSPSVRKRDFKVEK